MKATHRRSTKAPRARALVAIGLAGALAAGIGVVGIQTAGAAASGNLVRNSGFEKNLSGWRSAYTTANLSLAPSGHAGSHAARLTAKADGARVVLDDTPAVISKTKKGSTYSVGAWVRSSTSSPVTLRVREWKSGAIAGRASSTVTVAKTWKHITLTYVAKSSGGTLAVNVIIAQAKTRQWLDADTVSVRVTAAAATPPPSSGTGTSAPGDTLFGESMWMSSGESYAQTINRLENSYGRINVIRAFFGGLPNPWTSGILAAGGGVRPVNVSFKALPKDILAGKDDAALKSWFAAAPSNRKIWWTYYHEPEDNIANGDFTAADYRAAWRHIAAIADAVGPSNLKATLVLMDWSLDPGAHRNWKDYYPGDAYIDVLSWDSYNSHGRNPKKYFTPEWNFGTAVKVSKAAGKPFAFSEWGSEVVAGDNGSGRAAWMKASARYMADQGALFATYFDAPVVAEYRLLDTPSKNALRDIMAGKF